MQSSSRTPERANRLAIDAAPGYQDQAAALALQLSLQGYVSKVEAPFRVIVGADGLQVRWRMKEDDAERELHLDWCVTRPGRDPIVRAAGGATRAHELHVVDATAGLGADAVALARAGFRVTLIERDPVLCALLEDALSRARSCGGASGDPFAHRMTILQGDARALLPDVKPAVDVVVLDPMYPQLGKSGAKRHGAAFLRDWHGSPGEHAGQEEGELLAMAQRVAQRRVVVKRPLGASPIAKGVTGSIRGSTTRFDLYPTLEPS